MYDLAMFAPHVSETFWVEVGDAERFPILLIEATALPARPGVGRDDPFHLKFRSTGPNMLVQQIHRMSTAALGELDIFLVPIGQDAEGVTYEAIFN
jgi:hypothetical protein